MVGNLTEQGKAVSLVSGNFMGQISHWGLAKCELVRTFQWGWTDGSAVKSPDCSWKRSEFSFQHQSRAVHNCLYL